VTAEDKDSEHFGKVSYSVVETDSNDGDYFSISDDGWLMLAKPLDYERVGNTGVWRVIGALLERLSYRSNVYN
jgi:hypothetical protein